MRDVQNRGTVLFWVFITYMTVVTSQKHTRYRIHENDDPLGNLNEEDKRKRFLTDSSSQTGAVWSEWGEPTECSNSCGAKGFAQRLRSCSSGVNRDCEISGGRYWQVIICDNGPCAPTWLEWSTSSTCSATCGVGASARLRNCSTGTQTDCPGKAYAITICNAGDCSGSGIITTATTTKPTTPVKPEWSEWNIAVSCSVTCGPGFGEKIRTCSTGNRNDCSGKTWNVFTCNAGLCSAPGVWADWTSWSTCSATCSIGSQHRNRTCVFKADVPRGADCSGNSVEIQDCDAGLCPVNGAWSSWGAWSDCTQTCDEGLKFRLRNCTFPAGSVHGETCPGDAAESSTCEESLCKADGFWGQWSSWSRCSKSCGSGVHFKARQCFYKPGHPHGDPCAGAPFAKDACNTSLCPVDGVLSSWSNWGACSVTCGGGVQQRGRACTFTPGYPRGNDCNGTLNDVQDCHTELCPVDAVWRDWGTWTSCNATCGGGLRMRSRICEYTNPTAPRGKFCSGDTNDSEICNINLCAIDGHWSIWSKFSACTSTCGNGTRFRTRSCLYDPIHPRGNICIGASVNTEDCNTHVCPVDGVWSAWGSWASCSLSCGVGMTTRTRTCIFQDGVPHGEDCKAHSIETNVCNIFDCPTTTSTTTTTMSTVPGHWSEWNPWSTCTLTCGGGTKYRERRCTYPDHTLHGEKCPGPKNQTTACNTDNCPVDGVWSGWSSWARCSVTCESGTQTRNRTCNFKARYPKGENCTGADIDTQSCDQGACPVDGSWSDWSAWMACPVTCGGSNTVRTRTCEYPSGVPHGALCAGNNHENKTCGTGLCPVDGVLTDWANWTDCSVTCGNGTRERTRDCVFDSTKPRGADCVGTLNETGICNTNLCPVDGVWSEWSNWKTCSLSCGTGDQSRSRNCQYSRQPHGTKCPGSQSQTQHCNTNPCPVDGHWTDWHTWSSCSVTCSNGTQTRSRVCVYVSDHPRGDPCSGIANDTQTCNEGLCPVDGVWQEWSEWNGCTVTCGNGTTTRNRTCYFPEGAPHGTNCTGSESDQKICNTNLCPVDGLWGAWSNWTKCSLTCENGTRTRDRECKFDSVAPPGNNCTGPGDETEICNTTPCPVDGQWSVWSNWTMCSDTCGNGTQFRLRQCEFTPGHPRGNTCTGDANDKRTCNEKPCPVDGTWTDWGAWSECSKSCDNGTKSRDRNCTYDPPDAPRGKACNGSATETNVCHPDPCPIDGHWSYWSAFGTCSATCGSGLYSRTRTCIFHDPAPHGAKCFGNTTESSACNPELCPIDGQWSAWTNWTECSVTCGSGKQVRGRVCQYDPVAPKGSNCTGDEAEEKPCQPQLCPVDGVWSEWSNYTKCSATCGNGTQFRVRHCDYPDRVPHGENCTGSKQESQTCNPELCPVDGKWTTWSSWTDCPVTCGSGTKTRNRTCEFSPPAPQGDDCSGPQNETVTCNNNTCPVDGTWGSWTSFSNCSVTCGGGVATRLRTCTFPDDTPHGLECIGTKTNTKACNSDACPVDAVWSDWTSWEPCSVSCGGGIQGRTRNCTWPTAVHGSYCTGNDTETQNCGTLCPIDGVWTEWTKWTECSKSCNYGTKTRNRNCSFDDVHPRGLDCVGDHLQTQLCTNGLCPVKGQWGSWNSWGNCSESCGDGVQLRDRLCLYAVPAATNKLPCPGASNETQPCNEGVCPVDGVWTAWGSWTECSKTCNYGTQMRSRNCSFDDAYPRGLDCVGDPSQSKLCSNGFCPVQGQWGAWNSWGNCSESCGDGVQLRDRLCLYAVPAATNKLPCPGASNETQTCNDGDCPTTIPTTTTSPIPSTTSRSSTTNPPASTDDGVWSDWGNFTTCSASCGNGTQYRLRQCQHPAVASHGGNCTGAEKETQTCNPDPCPAPSTPPTTTVTTTPTTTLPPVQCLTCVGDQMLCEISFSPTTCTDPNERYCLNELNNNGDGSRTVLRRCATYDECFDGWWNIYSQDSRCTGFDQNYILTNAFKCQFCCVGDSCNLDINPKSSVWRP